MSASVPLDDLPRDLDALYALHDALCNQIAKVEDRICDLENAAEDWTAYRDCVTGKWCRSAE